MLAEGVGDGGGGKAERVEGFLGGSQSLELGFLVESGEVGVVWGVVADLPAGALGLADEIGPGEGALVARVEGGGSSEEGGADVDGGGRTSEGFEAVGEGGDVAVVEGDAGGSFGKALGEISGEDEAVASR